MADKNNDINVTKPGGIIHTDNDYVDQPKGTHRFALNAIGETSEGDQLNLSNESSNDAIALFKEGFITIGDEYIGDDLEVLILVNPTTGAEEIGTIDKSDRYTALVET